MKHYVSTVGDHHPESARIVLPLGISIKDIYRKYINQYEEDAISLQHFYHLWSCNMKHVSHQKVLRMQIIFTCH